MSKGSYRPPKKKLRVVRPQIAGKTTLSSFMLLEGGS